MRPQTKSSSSIGMDKNEKEQQCEKEIHESYFSLVDNDILCDILHVDEQQKDNGIPYQQYMYMNPLQEQISFKFINNQRINNEEIPQNLKANYESKIFELLSEVNSITTDDKQTPLTEELNTLIHYYPGLKNHYSSKINSLIKQQQLSSQHHLPHQTSVLNYSIDKHNYDTNYGKIQNDVLGSMQMDKLSQKLERNRECARVSRKRKKIYIELLEGKVNQLKEELNQSKVILKNAYKEVDKLQLNSKIFGNINSGGKAILQQLEAAQENNSSETDIYQIIDSFETLYGASGRNRITSIEILMKKFNEICLPEHIKNLFQIVSSQQTSNIQVGKRNRDLWSEFFNELELNQEQIEQIQNLKKKIEKQKEITSSKINKCNEIYNDIIQQFLSVQNIDNEIRTILSPKQMASYLLHFSKSDKLVKNPEKQNTQQSQYLQNGQVSNSPVQVHQESQIINNYQFLLKKTKND